MEDEKTFRERLGSDIKTVKMQLVKEEFKSFLAAIGFAGTAVTLVLTTFTGWSVLLVVGAYFCAKQFKPTIKRQIMYTEHLKFLMNIKKDKVWTQSDK